jgi:Tfp pilus assembly protein PilV
MLTSPARTGARQGRNQHGIALIESLVSIIIVMTGILGIAGLTMKSATWAGHAQYRTEAGMFASQIVRLIELKVSRSSPDNLANSLTAFQHQPDGEMCNFSGDSAGDSTFQSVLKAARGEQTNVHGLPGATAAMQQRRLMQRMTTGSRSRCAGKGPMTRPCATTRSRLSCTRACQCTNASSHAQRRWQWVGPSVFLIEIMVGLAIGLASMLAIYQLYATSEGRRTIVSISEAQTAGSMALFAIERDIRSAGLGFASIDARYLNCSVKAYNSGRSTAAFDFPLLPVHRRREDLGADWLFQQYVCWRPLCGQQWR